MTIILNLVSADVNTNVEVRYTGRAHTEIHESDDSEESEKIGYFTYLPEPIVDSLVVL